MDRFDTVRKGLVLGYVMQIGLGYTIAFLYTTPLWAWHRQPLARELLGQDDIPSELMPVVEQFSAMLGTTLACWGVACAWIAWVPLARKEPWAWWSLMVSLWAWGGVDTALSMMHGAWFNVMFNAFPLVVFSLALGAIYRDVSSPVTTQPKEGL